MEENTTLSVQGCLERLRKGDVAARQELVQITWRRLRAIASSKMRSVVREDAHIDSGDLFQETQIRLWQTLQTVTPESPRHFLNIAAQIMRQELIDLLRRGRLRRHQGFATGPAGSFGAAADGRVPVPGCETHDPAQAAVWTEFHERVEQLPAELREVFSLIWYQGISKGDVAELMGVNVRTVYRYWTEACDRLGELVE